MSIREKIAQQSIFWKAALILVLVLVLLIPMAMVKDLMRERQYRSQDVAREISQQWSGSQSLIGPVLTVKYKHFYGNKGKYYTKQLHMMPKQLDMDIKLEPEERYRGLFRAVVYRAKGPVSGYFDLTELKQRFTEDMAIDSLVASVGIQDKRGISERLVFNVNDVAHDMQSITHSNIFESGVETVLDKAVLSQNAKTDILKFDFFLNLKGSQNFFTLPIAEDTSVDIKSSWHSPSFYGAFLPDARDITDKGFSSSWNILAMNHSLPGIWADGEVNLNNMSRVVESVAAEAVDAAAYSVSRAHRINKHPARAQGFGVQLIIPANAYQQSERSAKYAILFIGLTFLAFFMAEVINKQRVHPLQYGLVGLALVMFYTLLVSFSEHIGFGLAYLIASSAVTILISGYARAVLRSRKLAKAILGLLAGLYIYLYVLLQLESYALLMGSIGLFGILALVMYLSRHIDWYQNRSGSVITAN